MCALRATRVVGEVWNTGVTHRAMPALAFLPASRTVIVFPAVSVIEILETPCVSKIINNRKYRAKLCVRPRNGVVSVVL